MRREKIIKKVVADVEKDVINDLCRTCNYYQICATRGDRKRPIWFCEEFDDYVPVKEMDILADQLSEFKEFKKEAETYKGLCVNCENRENCHFPKPNGGIWHCEEYE